MPNPARSRSPWCVGASPTSWWGLRFYDRREIKDLLAYLRLLVDLTDTVSLLRVINVPNAVSARPRFSVSPR